MKRSTTKPTKPAPQAAPAAETDTDVMHVLHKDHMLVSDLFFQFSQAKTSREKKGLVAKILSELYLHAKVEEDVVYPVVRKEGEDVEDIMDEADTEHHMIKVLMAELAEMEPSEKYFDAKVTVLCELVKHHVDEEEKEMFEKIEKADIDADELGKKVLARKEALKKQPITLSVVKTAAKNGKNGARRTKSA